MALSFEESLKKIVENNIAAPKAAMIDIDEAGVSPAGVMTLEEMQPIAAYSGEDGNWQEHNSYKRFLVFSDDNLSVINDKKEIVLNEKQINITQETNSQYIPFEMPRYYDGFDLVNATISIHFDTSDDVHGVSLPINVTYNDEKIRFGWLVDGNATRVAGKLKFEIHADGVVTDIDGNSLGYTWKTKFNESMNVLQSLCDSDCHGRINVDDSWVQELVESVVENVAQQIAGVEVAGQVQAAQTAANQAEAFASDAEQAAANAASAAETVVNSALAGYAKTEYVDEAIRGVDVSEQLTNYATVTYVDEAVKGVDVSEQLNDYAKTEYVNEQISGISDNLSENYSTTVQIEQNVAAALENYATNDDVTQAINAADISGKLENYYSKDETYNQTEIDTKIANVQVDLTGYATEKFVTDKTDVVSSAVDTNAQNISSLSEAVTELQETIASVDTSARLTYDVAYNDIDDPNVGENVFVFYEIENEGQENEVREAKKKFTIVGGSGGGATSSTLKIGYVTTSPFVITTNDKAEIKYTFSGTDSSGDAVTEGTATWKVAGKVVATNIAVAGENTFDATEYLSVGTQKVNLSITDEAGSLVTKTWTVQKIDVRLDSNFNDKFTYPMGPVSLDFTPYGAISKDVHFILDGKEIDKITTASSGIPMSYELPTQTHGAHLVEMYITAEINGNDIESNHIKKDILWYDGSTSPVIGTVYQKFTARQYDTTNIEVTVYDPITETPTVSIAVDNEVVSTQTLTEATFVYPYKTDVVGEHTITITCGEVVKTLVATITKLDINVSPVTAGLVFDFNPAGKSNNDADRLWTNDFVAMTVSDNFDWINGGYQFDENGDQYFCVKAGTTAEINYQLFADDAKKNGKEFKVVFKTTNIKNRDTSFISCMNNSIGLDMKVESANIYSSNGSLYSPYCEDDIIEFEFNINKNTDIPMVLTYEDGVPNRPMIYTSDSSFWQTEPQPIVIGSADCDVHIYRMKAYSNSLSDSNILANFIADARNADEMVSRYNRNQIYDENNLLTPEVLAEKCPDLRVIIVDAPWFTNDKDNKVDDTTIRMIYKNGDPVLDNWTCTGARHSGQGTSSNEYGYAGRNIDLIMDTDTALFTLGDGKTTSSTITLTRDSVPTDYLNVKVNIASSENENNAQFARRYNQYNPFVRAAKFNNPNVKDCMEFYNCVVFIRERNEDVSTHREFLDTNTHFYAIGNVGDSKKTDDTRVNDKNDPKECVIEITDFNVPLAEFPTGNPDGICSLDDWKAGNTAYDYLYADYKYKDGKFKSFGSESYEFRYEMKGITEEQREENINAWREFYKFVVTSTDSEFYAKLKEYFVVDSALYYYLFTERYLMVDNRAKNSFWHYGKVYITEAEALTLGEGAAAYIVDDEQAAIRDGYRWDLTFFYDADTALGIDNTGKLVLTYGQEDTDYYVTSEGATSYIYRAAESNFFCRVRDLFTSEMQAMFVDRENANAWSANSLINQWDTYQSQFPEELWRLDIQRKYMRTYQGISLDNSIAGTANPRFLVEMLNGRKKYQRRMFERNQELYMATKYFGKTATQDQIMMRFNNPETYVVKPDFTLYLTPYSDMYIGVKFGNVEPVNFRAKAGVEYEIPYSIDAENADITLIYGASFIQTIGDLSKCYVGDNDFSKATRLQGLTIGSNVEGYTNSYMSKISLGNNKLLEYLDIRNITGLSSVVDLSECGNLIELHAEGSSATGVIFANSGKLQRAYIPDVVSLTAKNLNYIEEFEIAGYTNLQTLVVENTPFIDVYNIVNSASKLQTVRLTGIDWNLEDTTILDKLLSMRGIGADGSEIAQSVLAGKIHVPVIKQQQLYEYQSAWPDLEIARDTMIEQFAVTFVNDDDTVLEVQYVDKGENAVDPTTRIENPIIPTKASSVQYDYTFTGWDSSLTGVFSDRTIKAIYSESLRSYTIKYMSKGTVMQESTGLYGENIPYVGDNPIYTKEEVGYTYYLFNRWDKSGVIDGEKTVEAIFDKFVYSEGAFDGKELKELSPVEIYAMNKLGLAETVVSDKDQYSFVIGNDVQYDDIRSELLISQKTHFDGSNYIDTGIQLFDEDRDFVLAIDYEFDAANKSNAVLAQCFQANGSNGFKFWYGTGDNFAGSRLTWGTASDNIVAADKREVLVIRHKKGENNLTLYKSNLDTEQILTSELTRTKNTIGTSTLVFGCAKADDGIYENHAIGDIHWCKLWYMDLGDDVCRSLAMWTHETLTLEACGFRKYYLTDDTSKRCSFSLLATHLLDRPKKWSTSYNTVGSWAQSSLNSSLNTRLYNAMPTQIKALLKQVIVYSSAGNMSLELEPANCYITVPAAIELDSTMNSEPYNSEGTPISYLTTNGSRRRAYRDGDYNEYWTRSPNVKYTSYIWRVDKDGYMQGVTTATNNLGVLIEISF